jgi:protease stability complex PrcB-like protein
VSSRAFTAGSLLPALLVAALVCVACRRAAPGDGPSTQAGGVTMTRVYRSDNSGLSDSLRTVVTDSVAWQRLWSEIMSNRVSPPPPPAPRVDFARDMLIAVAMRPQPTTGRDIVIESVTRTPTALEIRVLSVRPGGSCFSGAMITHPVDVVRVPRSTLPPRFIERHTTMTAC